MDTDLTLRKESQSNPTFEKFPKKIINILFGDEYYKILSSMKEMEDKTKQYYKDIEKKINEKYKEFNSNIEQYLYNITNKFSTVFGLNEDNINQRKLKEIQNRTKKYLDKLIKIKNMQEQIIENIKLEQSILLESFNITRNLDNDKSIVNIFLEKEFNNIINSWLFTKIDLQNFNLIKALDNSNLDQNYKYIIQNIILLSHNKTYIMDISQPEKNNKEQNTFSFESMKSNESKLIPFISKNLTKMKISKIGDVDTPFRIIGELPKLKKIEIKHCLLSKSSDKNSLIQKFPTLETLIFKGVYNFDLLMLNNITQNLTKLILSNNNFINTDYNNIMEYCILKSTSLKKNLEVLSFSNNNLTDIELDQGLSRFYSLREIDFQRNRITNFKMENFNEVICINCCYNKFSTELIGNDNTIVLLSGNIFLTNKEKCKEYYNKLEKKLKNNEISLTHLAISFLPKEFTNEFLERIIINNTILINLKYLDLSYNSMNCTNLFAFFNNNKGLINLKELNLSGNQLDDTFFEKYLNNNYNSLFSKIKKINLSNNLIGSNNNINIQDLGEEPKERKEDVYKFRLIYKFIINNKNLSKLYLTKNPINEKIEIPNNVNINNYTSNINRDNQNKIIIDSFYSLLKKIFEEISMNKEEKDNRGIFNLKFDINRQINLNSKNINFKE